MLKLPFKLNQARNVVTSYPGSEEFLSKHWYPVRYKYIEQDEFIDTIEQDLGKMNYYDRIHSIQNFQESGCYPSYLSLKYKIKYKK